MRKIRVSFHVVVGQASSIRNVGRCIQSSGIELSGLTLEPLADAVLSQEEKKAGVALIDRWWYDRFGHFRWYYSSYSGNSFGGM
jgi:hypothetical protein